MIFPLVGIFFHSGGFGLETFTVTAIREQLFEAAGMLDSTVWTTIFVVIGTIALVGVAGSSRLFKKSTRVDAVDSQFKSQAPKVNKHESESEDEEQLQERADGALRALKAGQVVAEADPSFVSRNDMAMLQDKTFGDILKTSLLLMFGSSIVLTGHWFLLVLGIPAGGMLYFTYVSYRKRKVVNCFVLIVSECLNSSVGACWLTW